MTTTTHMIYLFIIVVSVILSSTITSALPTLKQKWNAFKNRRKQLENDIDYLHNQITILENEMFDEDKIKEIVLEYLKELQK